MADNGLGHPGLRRVEFLAEAGRSLSAGRKAFFAIIAAVLPLTSNAQSKDIDYTNQQWIQYYGQLNLSDNWTLLADAGYRSANTTPHRWLYIVRAAIGYQLNPGIRLSAGFAHLGLYRSGELRTSENRPFQEILGKQGFGAVDVAHRLRVEERFFRDARTAQSSFNFRFRYRLLLTIPLMQLSSADEGKRLLLNFGDEIFINAGDEIVYSVFDQNRLLLGVLFQLHRNLGINVSYNHQLIGLRSPGAYEQDYILWLGINHTMTLKGRGN